MVQLLGRPLEAAAALEHFETDRNEPVQEGVPSPARQSVVVSPGNASDSRKAPVVFLLSVCC